MKTTFPRCIYHISSLCLLLVLSLAWPSLALANEYGYTEKNWEPPNAPVVVIIQEYYVAFSVNHALIHWETASELDIIGFNVYRANNPQGERTQINSSLVPSQVSGIPIGAIYEITDENVEPGVTYYYWVEVVAVGYEYMIGPESGTGVYGFFAPTIMH